VEGVVFAASFYLRKTGGASIVGGRYTIPVLFPGLGGELVFRRGAAGDRQSDAGAEVKVKAEPLGARFHDAG
jgi:hypothetical protein